MQLTCVPVFISVENGFHEVIKSYQRRLQSHSAHCHRSRRSGPDGCYGYTNGFHGNQVPSFHDHNNIKEFVVNLVKFWEMILNVCVF
ncbi:hypothetical protein DPMN_120206 [Dreissena polymorpha]|uniref:Uncharacterized protein n=1 Tax=Dreissena polymorpha TaxID=45954 RepID=A0A9D4GJZ9_DREPO|nr:hypothetical protein DPMN_120206 [Dreissena polymorpha]